MILVIALCIFLIWFFMFDGMEFDMTYKKNWNVRKCLNCGSRHRIYLWVDSRCPNCHKKFSWLKGWESETENDLQEMPSVRSQDTQE